MSRPFYRALHDADKAATNALLSIKSYGIPERLAMSTDTEYRQIIEFELEDLEDDENLFTERFNELKDCEDALNNLRVKMTVAEREKDAADYDKFLTDMKCMYLENKRKLQDNLLRLKTEKKNLERELKKLPALKEQPYTKQDQTEFQNHEILAAKTLAPRHISLPQIKLPKFDGEISQWTSFWERYCYAIHDVDPAIMPPVLKFTYLIDCLHGKAKNAISGLPVESGNYLAAIKILQNEFGKENVIRNSLYNELQNIAPTSGSNQDLREFVDNLERVLHQLEQMGEPTEVAHIQITIKKKLPSFLLSKILEAEANTPPGSVWTTTMLRQKLKLILHLNEEKARVLEQSKTERKSHIQRDHQQDHSRLRVLPHRGDKNFRAPTAPQHSLTFASIPQREIRTRKPCVFCGANDHAPTYCTKYTDHESRVNRLRELHYCFKCMKTDHYTRDCQFHPKCNLCGKEHSSMLCFKAAPKSQPHSSERAPRNFKLNIPQTIQDNSNNPNFSKIPENSRFNIISDKESLENNNTNAAQTFNTTVHYNNLKTATEQPQILLQKRQPVLLKCAKVKVSNYNNPNQTREALVLFDDGSTVTYVSESFAKNLKLPSQSEELLEFGVFADPKNHQIQSRKVTFLITLIDGSLLPIHANTIPYLTQPVPHCLIDATEIESLKNGEIPVECHWGIPDILIGSDFYNLFHLQTPQHLPSGFSLNLSRIGPLLCGTGKGNVTSFSLTQNSSNVSITLSSIRNESLIKSNLDISNKLIEDFFSLESIGIRESGQEDYEKSAMIKFHENLKFNGERYEVGFPWKEQPPDLPINYGLSLGRLRSAHRLLLKRPEIMQKYDNIIKEQLESGVIEKVETPLDTPYPVHYMPHQPVVRNDKGKVRIVYDASSKTSKLINSLNDCIYPGPVLMENLAGILMRFRLAPIAVVCDIEKAFLQVGVREEDRDVTRFLWLKDIKAPIIPTNLVTYRFKRVAFGLTCSPFLLAAVVLHHLTQNPSKIAQEIAANLYVDNILLIAENSEEAQEKCKITKELFRRAGMNVREYTSNDKESIKNIPEEDKLSGEEQKFLGIPWKLQYDTLQFNYATLNENSPTTKRIVLSIIASLFDPLGLLSPTLIIAKQFLQKLWSYTYQWDQPLSPEHTLEWQKISENFKGKSISIPRKITEIPLNQRVYQIHAFTDASSFAFACCVYLRISDKISRHIVNVNLVFAKGKVRPKKFDEKFSIHRMELLAAGIGAKALEFVKREIFTSLTSDNETFTGAKIEETLNLWTDSSTVLHWLRSSVKQDVFIENRLKPMREMKNLMCRYITTGDNPADIGSRGYSVDDLQNSVKWKMGPEWLSKDQELWPTVRELPPFISNDAKNTGNDENKEVDEFTFLINQNKNQISNSILNPNEFNRWPKLLRTTSFVFYFIKRIAKNKNFYSETLKNFPISAPPTSKITVPQLRYVQNYWFKMAQSEFPPSENERRDLNLYTDNNGILRSKGRIENSLENFDLRFPIFLPPKARVTTLWVTEVHLNAHHSGTLTTLSQVRRSCWLPKGRKTVARIIWQNCLRCRRFKALPFRAPEAPALPTTRVCPATPFQHCGVDYFGPLNVKFEGETKKIWVSLFTCLVVRAIHLELVLTLSADSFIDALKRFSARRGLPKSITSDNGTQFVLSAKTLEAKFRAEWRQLFSSDTLNRYITEHGITWKFITEKAPWKGGFYERLVGSVKTHLRPALSRSLLTFERMYTLLTEIEGVVNSRPITFLSNQLEAGIPLRPIDFLIPYENTRVNFLPFQEDEKDPDYIPTLNNKENLLISWQRISTRLDKFWHLWTKDYLTALRERKNKAKNNPSINRLPEIGEVVLVEEKDAPRNTWNTAIVTAHVKSDDGLIRSAQIKTKTGKETRRAITQLYPLELSDEKSELVAQVNQ